MNRDELMLRTPPASTEAEQSVLGALLLDNQAFDSVSWLCADAFYASSHRRLWSAITGLIEAGKQADIVTVCEALGPDLEKAGGQAYIGAIVQNTPGAMRVQQYAEIVRQKAVQRTLAQVGAEIVEAALSPAVTDAGQLLDEAEAKILRVSESTTRTGQGPVELRPLLAQVVERVDFLYHRENQSDVSGLSTGFIELDSKTAGLQAGDLIIVAGRPSMGKAQPLDAKVLKADGQWARMGELSIGDALASIDGTPSIVTGVFPQGRKQVLRVTFSDGRSTECCAEHLWRVSHRKWEQPRVMSAAEVADIMARPSMMSRLWVDSLSGDFGSDAQLPVDPWLLGALLGDGGFTGSTISFSKIAEETIERVRSALPETVEMVPAGGCSYRLSVPRSKRTNPLTASIRALGLAGCFSADKFIPEIYMAASRTDRLNLLRGLLDTDGWVEKAGSVLYSTASQRLARDVQSLARGLGYWCSINTSPAHYTYKGERLRGLDQNRLVISGVDLDDLFLFEAKRARCVNRTRRKRIAFKSIAPAGEAMCQCISVSHPSHLYVTDDYIVTHNTALAVNIAEHVAVEKRLPVLIFSMEMSGTQLATRLAGSIGRIDQHKLRTGRLTDDEWAALSRAMGKLNDAPIYIDETAALNVIELRSWARRLWRKCGGKLGLIVVDYLQLMSAVHGGGENRATEIAEISRSLKALAKELNVPVVALSQLNRSVEQRQDKRPTMSDLRESGALEQDADVILFVFREEVYYPDNEELKGIAELIIGKQRNGPIGKIDLTFLAHFTRFENYASLDGSPRRKRVSTPRPAKRSVVSVDFKTRAAGED